MIILGQVQSLLRPLLVAFTRDKTQLFTEDDNHDTVVVILQKEKSENPFHHSRSVKGCKLTTDEADTGKQR